VRSPFAGILQSFIAVEGERVTHRQPIAWLRSN
jgi:[acyl-carrier-protein] S-malonyltransferase